MKEVMFHELKEIDIITEIKNIITYFYGSKKLFVHTHSKEELLTWLEKQAEQKPVELPKVNPENLREELDKAIKIYKPDGNFGFGWVTLYNIAYHFFELGFKANKVEPKFKVGDWIVNNITKEVFKITELIDYGYESIDENDKTHTLFIDENEYHLWTIQDAKDGDVLYNKDDFAGNSVFIYKGISDKTHACLYYIRLFKDKDFIIYNDIMWENGGGVNGGEFYPATKEQRLTLFAKMKEAGYNWDGEKKKLEKINDKFDFSRMKPFTPVLARTGDNQTWFPHFFESYHPQNHLGEFYMIECQHTYSQCVPFEGNEKLFRTQDPIPPFYDIR